jgi:hypothetical protein
VLDLDADDQGQGLLVWKVVYVSVDSEFTTKHQKKVVV